jgi:carboxypeptidase family protein
VHGAWRATVLSALLGASLATTGGLGAQDTASARRARSATVVGVVIDSLHNVPLTNAEVQLDGANRLSRTDSAGHFRMDSVPPGTFRLGVFHPLLDSLGVGVASPPLTARAGDTLAVTLATPSVTTIAAGACQHRSAVVGSLARALATGPAVVLGRVLDADTEQPIANAVVSFTWVEVEASKESGFHRFRHTRQDTTAAGGEFRLCHLPINVVGALHAVRRDGGAAAASADASRDLAAQGHLLTIVTLHLPPLTAPTIASLAATASAPASAADETGGATPGGPPAGGAPTASSSSESSAAAPPSAPERETSGAHGKPANAAARAARPVRYATGTASLAGQVRNPASQPIANARVYVMGAADSALTAADGQFTLHNLPSGTRTLVVRSVGFEPVTMPVELTTREARHVIVPFTATAVPVLTPIVITARLDASLKRVGFDQRRRAGDGTFMTAEQIDKHKAYDFHDLFTTFPGVRVDYSSDGHASLMATQGAGGCIGYAAVPGKGVQTTPGQNCGPCLTYVVDGSRYEEYDEGDMDTFVRPEEIGAIEVYQQNHAPRSIPGVTKPECVNIVIWTKAKLGI